MVKIPTLEEMLKAGMHFGHRTSKWHPKMAPFIFGQRAGVHIIDLQKTQAMLTEALEFVSRMVAENKTILLVGTKDQVRAPVAKLGLDLGLPYINNRWLGGTLTNFSVIKRLIKNYLDLKEKKETGKLTKYTKKEQLEFSRQIAKLDRMVGGITSLKKLPDVIFIWDIKHERTALAEAKKKGVPVVAVCDTNVDPTGVKYVIPGNDDATKTVKLVLDYLRQAISEGKAQAKTAKPAENGQGAKKQ